MGAASSPPPPPAGPPAPLALRLLAPAALAASVAVAGLLGWHSLADLDIWFHLRAGQEIMVGRGFPGVNTFGFLDAAHPWLNHEWLFQLLALAFAGDNPVAGWNVLRILLVLALVATLGLGDGRLAALRRGRTGPVLGMAVALLAGLLLMWPRFNLRPELISYIGFILLVRWCEGPATPPGSRPWQDRRLAGLFVLVLVWAQCHGFAALAPVVLLLGAIAASLVGPGKTSLGRRLWPVAVAVAALALTPNHLRGLLFPLRALGQFRGEGADLAGTVSELVPLLETPNSLHLTLLAFKGSLVVGALAALLAGRNLPVLRLVLWGAAALATLASQRVIGLYGVTFVLLLTGLSRWPDPGWRARLRLERVGPGAGTVAAALVALGVLAGAGIWATAVVTDNWYLAEGVGRRFGGGATPATYPAAAAAAVSGTDRTLANLDAAAYLLGTTEARLFIDGRTEAYPAVRWREYRILRDAGPPALSLIERVEATAVVLALRSGAFVPLAEALLASPAWRPVAADAAGVAFRPVAPDTPAAIDLAAAADGVLASPGMNAVRRADLALAAASLYRLAGHAPGQRRALVAGLDAAPGHPQLNHNLGNLLLAEGEFATARDHFRRAVAVNPRLAGTHLNLGVCALRLGDAATAIDAFGRALDIDPGQVGGWINLAVALRTTGDNEGAIGALEKALALRPGDSRLQGQLRQWRRGG